MDKIATPTITLIENKVNITCETPNVILKFTTNGFSPSLEKGKEYSQPFELTSQFRGVRARAFKDGMEESKIAVLATRLTKTIRLNIFPLDDKDNIIYKKVVGSIQQFRQVAASTVGKMYLAESAITTWNADKNRVDPPKKDLIKSVIGELTGKTTGNPLESYIKDLAPSWYSFLVQECSRMIESTMSSKDPHKPKLDRRFLIHNHDRNIPSFRFVGLPILHCASSQHNIEWEGFHRIKLKWDKIIGEIRFGILGKKTASGWGLDPYQISVIKRIQSGEFQQGTTEIMENEGQLYLAIPYSYIPNIRNLSIERELEVEFTDIQEKFIKAKIDLKTEINSLVDIVWCDDLSAIAAVAQVRTNKIQQSRFEKMREACGSKVERRHGSGHPKGFNSISEKIERLSNSRSNAVKTWNHIWASRIVSWAVKRDCGVLTIHGLPSDLFGWPWQFADLKSKIEYKAKTEGILIQFVDKNDQILNLNS